MGLGAVHVLDQPDGAAAPQRDGARARPARRHGAPARPHRRGGGVRGEAGPRTPRQAQMQGEFRFSAMILLGGKPLPPLSPNSFFRLFIAMQNASMFEETEA